MRYLSILLVIVAGSVSASPWPPELVQSVFDRCARMGGKGQCQCVVLRLQEKFTFEDVRLSASNKLANEALRQMTQTFNVKCLDKKYKEETLALEKEIEQLNLNPNRFR